MNDLWREGPWHPQPHYSAGVSPVSREGRGKRSAAQGGTEAPSASRPTARGGPVPAGIARAAGTGGGGGKRRPPPQGQRRERGAAATAPAARVALSPRLCPGAKRGHSAPRRGVAAGARRPRGAAAGGDGAGHRPGDGRARAPAAAPRRRPAASRLTGRARRAPSRLPSSAAPSPGRCAPAGRRRRAPGPGSALCWDGEGGASPPRSLVRCFCRPRPGGAPRPPAGRLRARLPPKRSPRGVPQPGRGAPVAGSPRRSEAGRARGPPEPPVSCPAPAVPFRGTALGTPRCCRGVRGGEKSGISACRSLRFGFCHGRVTASGHGRGRAGGPGPQCAGCRRWGRLAPSPRRGPALASRRLFQQALSFLMHL